MKKLSAGQFLRAFAVVALMLSFSTIYSQDRDSIFTNRASFVRLHFMVPGIDYEKPLSNNFTIKFGLSSSIAFGNSMGVVFNPYLIAEQRYYLDLFKDKPTSNREEYFKNFYISLEELYFIKENAVMLGTLVGKQFTFGKRWYLDFGFGITYDLWTANIDYFSLVNFNVGIILD